MKKRDIVLLISVIGAAVLIFAVVFAIGALGKGDTVVISIDGEVYDRFPLDEDIEHKIPSDNGGYNILVIKDGQAYVSEASCPDKTCVNMGNAEDMHPVVCLPNKVVITIEKD